MANSVYSSVEWEEAKTRVLVRDGFRCSVGRLLGGECSPPDRPLHVHHAVRPEAGGDPYGLDNLISVCASHHPQLEALRRWMERRHAESVPRCPHKHVHQLARELCEERLAREAVA